MNLARPRNAFSRLVLYHRVLETAPAKAILALLNAVAAGADAAECYLEAVRVIYAAGPCTGPAADAWQNLLLARILSDENALTVGASVGCVPRETIQAAAHDLRLLQELFALTATVCRSLAGDPDLPIWPGWPAAPTRNPAAEPMQAMAAELAAAADWGALTERLVEYHQKAGAGLTASYWYLRWDGELQGIAEPHVFDLDDLMGLQEAKETVVRNTEQFVRGGSGNNLLLYGSRGTGKSSMVRGLAARYGAEGLRLVEVSRTATSSLPALFRSLKQYPQRFVLFLDDLSFDEEDVDFKTFKSVVEGALEQQPANVLLYATTNRRHLVPERWSDRNTPDVAEIHGQDTLEEKLSLADRFGITVLFPSPDQEEYLRIVEHMARQRGILLSAGDLREAALRWVMWNNPRSGRSARQFVDDLAGRLLA